MLGLQRAVPECSGVTVSGTQAAPTMCLVYRKVSYRYSGTGTGPARPSRILLLCELCQIHTRRPAEQLPDLGPPWPKVLNQICTLAEFMPMSVMCPTRVENSFGSNDSYILL